MIANFVQGFDFSIVLSDDSQYGVEEEPGNWTGLIGMVQREVAWKFTKISINAIFKEIDVIAADLTQTWSRMAVVDFSKPFLATSLTLLLKVTATVMIIINSIFPGGYLLLTIIFFNTIMDDMCSFFLTSFLSPQSPTQLTHVKSFPHKNLSFGQSIDFRGED